MEKFLKIFVTAADITGGFRIISLNNIIAVEQASATTVTIIYSDAAATLKTMTITHDALPAYAAATPGLCNAMRDWFTDSMVIALAQSWQKSSTTGIAPLPLNAAGTAHVTITKAILS